jgi:plasmid stabilization system protein ParE
MRVHWLRKVQRGRDDEAAGIASDDPVAPSLVVERVVGAIVMIAGQPAPGRPGRAPRTRGLMALKTRYVVPCRVRDKAVEIRWVFHTARRVFRSAGRVAAGHPMPSIHRRPLLRLPQAQ